MTPEQWREIKPILESALELDPGRRPAFLDSACTNRTIRTEVESLLVAHDRADNNVLQVVPSLRIDAEEEARYRLPLGKRIGVYKILDEIAVGGMGAVYRASRDDGQYKQEVALKIVRTELGGELGSARFKNERQILASLDHPNIAKILDGGTTSDGIPFLIMELIDGLPITEYCDRHLLSISARIELFRAVCSAVHYAHQRLVIHRDLKPSNILVTAQGIPKLLDFGIAKILDPRAISDTSELTVAGTTLMTPAYASPEQLLNEPITTATDVYSLGCVLYEILTGYRALQLTSHVPHEIARAVLEKDPDKPSSIVRRAGTAESDDVSRLRADTPRKLQRRLRGDLDNIVMHTIRKEAAARYQSVDQLSEDLRRHLHAEPVLARKSTLSYQIGKFVSRHKIAVAATAAVFLTVLAGLVITLHEARIARENELRAEQRFNEIRKLANSLIFEIHDSIRPLAGATTARKLIIQHAQEYLENLARESDNDPALLKELAAAYTKLANIQGSPNDSKIADTKTALESYRKAVALLETAAALQPADRAAVRQLAANYYRMATALAVMGDTNGRDSFLQKSVAILEPLAAANPEDPEVQRELGVAYGRSARFLRGQGDLAQAFEQYRKALAIYERLHTVHPENNQYVQELSHSHRHIGTFLAVQRKFPEALEHYQAASAIDAAQLALDPKGLETRYNATLSDSAIAFVLGEQGDVDGALDYYRKVLAARTALLDADAHDNRSRNAVAETLEYIGVNLARKKDHAGALDSYKKALVTWEDFARGDPTNKEYGFEVAWTQAGIGQVYAAMARSSPLSSNDRVKYCRESRDWYRKALPTWIEGQTQVKLGVGGPEARAELERNIAECESVIAREHTAKLSLR